MHRSRSHDVVIRVYDAVDNVIENGRARGRVQKRRIFLAIGRLFSLNIRF
jgi:hypothetical protein